MPNLELRDVSKRFEGASRSAALSGINLAIPQGQFIAIVGPSGGGKSTLLNLLGLLAEPSSGEYLIDGEPVGSDQIAQLRSDTFAFIFQSFHLLERRRAQDSVELGLLYRATAALDRGERAHAALQAVGLAASADQLATTLSGGEKQRVAIARALASEAPIIVADEPTGNLDSVNGAAVLERLTAMHSRGATIVLVTHDPAVAAIAERRVRIVDGRIVDDSAPGGKPAVGSVATRNPMAARVRVRDLWIDAWRSIWSRTGRTLGLMAAVAVAIGLMVSSLGISESARSQVSDIFDLHANRDVTVRWGLDFGENADSAAEADVAALERLAGVRSAALFVDHGQVDISAGDRRPALTVAAVTATPDLANAGRMRVVPEDATPAAGDVLLGATLAAQLDLAPVATEPIVTIDRERFRVVGLIESAPRQPGLPGGIVFSTADAAALPYAERVAALVVSLPGAAQQIAGQAALALDPIAPDRMEVSAPTDPRTLRDEVEGGVQTTLLALTVVAAIAATASLANAMLASVLERRQEFGLRLAVGARPRHVAWLVIVESTWVGALGGLAGLFGGMAVILAVTLTRQWAPVFDLALAPAAIGLGVGLGALCGLFAARRAARISPSEALRS